MGLASLQWKRSQDAREQLVVRLQEQGVLRSDRVAQAFLQTPREAFVSTFYEQQGGPQWIEQKPGMFEEGAWIEKVYRNKPLVLLCSERNHAISSSSAPAVMALMLEALHIEPGMHVLEIGTGSGYNAALLARLAGDPRLVTTIEVDPSLAEKAQYALRALVGEITVRVGDGRQGESEYAPYDRIIATASSPAFPRPWFEQLAPHGQLVMDLQGSLNQSSFLLVQKSADGRKATGVFSDHFIYFMPLRPAEHDLPLSSLLQKDITQEITLAMPALSEMLFDEAFHWFLQWRFPGITRTNVTLKQGGPVGQRIITLVDVKQETLFQLTEIKEGQWFGRQRGGRGLWLRIERAYAEWCSYGKPAQSAYHVEIDEEKAELVLAVAEKRFPL